MKNFNQTNITSNLVSAIAIGGVILTSFYLAACGESKAPGADLPEKTIEITGNDQMKFDIESFQVRPGQKVKVVFTNVGTMPKESMGHNVVFLDRNTDPEKFVEAGFTHAGNDYIAPDTEKSILAHTKLLGPGESETITFTAPRVPSQYDYVCTFPGHLATGMRGKMIVQ